MTDTTSAVSVRSFHCVNMWRQTEYMVASDSSRNGLELSSKVTFFRCMTNSLLSWLSDHIIHALRPMRLDKAENNGKNNT